MYQSEYEKMLEYMRDEDNNGKNAILLTHTHKFKRWENMAVEDVWLYNIKSHTNDFNELSKVVGEHIQSEEKRPKKRQFLSMERMFVMLKCLFSGFHLLFLHYVYVCFICLFMAIVLELQEQCFCEADLSFRWNEEDEPQSEGVKRTWIRHCLCSKQNDEWFYYMHT